MATSTKTRFAYHARYFLMSATLIFPLVVRAESADAVSNFVASTGAAVGCGVLSSEEGQALLKASASAARERGIQSSTNLQQVYDDSARATKAKPGTCEFFKNQPELVQKIRDAADRQLSLSAASSSTPDDAELDAQEQRDILSSLASDPKVVVPYVPDPKLAEKAASVQAIYNASVIAMWADECGLLPPEYSFKSDDPIHSDPLSNLWYHDLGALVPDGRDFAVAAHHNLRVFYRDYPWLAPPAPKDQWCPRLAQSQELEDAKRRLREVK